LLSPLFITKLNFMIKSSTQRREEIIANYQKEKQSLLLPIFTSTIFKAEMANNSFIKRFIDLIISISLFAFIFSWLFPLIAVLIKINSRGPLFFVQHRTGLNDKPVLIYKFRTMTHGCSNVDSNGNYLQAVKNDPRITKIGSILRKTSLDELPQFWNVLMGEMSIVGPRPHPKELNEECEPYIEYYHLRHLVKPGITGMAQIKGFRGPTPDLKTMQKRINYDVWYINNWNLLLDLKIILLTFQNLISGDEKAF